MLRPAFPQKEQPMKYVGVDLHQQLIVWCVVVVESGQRRLVAQRKLACRDASSVDAFFRELGPFEVAVEATAAYEWLLERIEGWAQRIVLVHPRKMRIIAESRRKTDRLDARILAEFLAAGELPEAWRPTPRVREHRALMRQWDYLRRKSNGLKCKLRNILACYNADIPNPFSVAGRAYVQGFAFNGADRFVVDQLLATLDMHHQQRLALRVELRKFAEQASIAEQEARAVLDSVPGVGLVTTEVVLSELGEFRRFRSQDAVVQYAGLAPGIRESAGRRKSQGITKEGSPLLRWTMIQLAWRLVGKSRRWGHAYEQLARRCGSKKAIVAVARRVLCVLFSMLRRGQRYNLALDALPLSQPGARPRVSNQRPQVPPPNPHLLPSSL
jgi:transposase